MYAQNLSNHSKNASSHAQNLSNRLQAPSNHPHKRSKRLLAVISAIIVLGAAAFVFWRSFIGAPTPENTSKDASVSEAANPADGQSSTATEATEATEASETPDQTSPEPSVDPAASDPSSSGSTATPSVSASPSASQAQSATNCTLKYAELSLINPVFTVSTDFIAARRQELIDVSAFITEGNPWNGAPLLDPTAAAHLRDLQAAYQAAYPGHTLETRSCFRSVGTNCGRLCYATGTSDHHSGYTCDLIDPAYGTTLDTDDYATHLEWQWLKAHAHEFGFIDRFPAAWAGGPMTTPVSITADGSTGLYETWHYRYVGLTAAAEIASGLYNNGAYDSLEHYLLATGRVTDLLAATCPN